MRLAAIIALATALYALGALARRLGAQCERLVERARRDDVGEDEP